MEQPLTVSELAELIKFNIEGLFPTGLWVTGEIREWKPHSSGHIYFTLIDRKSQIACIIWRSTAATLDLSEIEEGMQVELFARLTTYQRQSQYQLIVSRLLPKGVGERAILFKRLKEKLEKEGLFNPEFKKPIPTFPEVIGVITSPTGAAIRDIINVATRRAPHITIILRPTIVQGKEAARDIAEGIKEMDEHGGIDLLIVGRGGGSEEDLWCFNEEIVARAIFSCRTPVISAVGHETDFSISDFVADVRAPTPSAAAEIAVPDVPELMKKQTQRLNSVGTSLLAEVSANREKLQAAISSYGFRSVKDRVMIEYQTLDNLMETATREINNTIKSRSSALKNLESKLSSLSPINIMKRGYSVVYKQKKVISDSLLLTKGDTISIRFYRGKAEGEIKEVE
ncbi:exodeoxyribonuclease VII large subunit [bacterium]|nr:exodeoxyribonuclease VII large subunit [bacterium]